jgi:hypothetical protein
MQEEDRKLRDFVMVNGRKGWAKIASALEGRTGKQCRNRWYHVLDPELSNVGAWNLVSLFSFLVASFLFSLVLLSFILT